MQYDSGGRKLTALRDASLTVRSGECVGLVGESGSGKTQMFMATMGLLGPGGRATGSVQFEGKEILGSPAPELNRVRGSKLTMVFQDPMTSLTPHLRVGVQLGEILVTHARASWRDAEDAALRMLERVRVPDPERRMRQYPHQLSGGMRQRVMIGMSLLCEPTLLIADEPTTALDVTVQAQIMETLRAMRDQYRMAMVLISHDLGVVAALADRIVVMYAGRIVENAPAAELLQRARHPYAAELLKCVPNLREPRRDRMPSLAGVAPDPFAHESGCAFAPRCPRVGSRCHAERPALQNATGTGHHQVACHHPVPHE